MFRKVVRSRAYQKDLQGMPAKDREAIEARVSMLEGDWKALDVAPLKGTDLWRMRVRDYRVFFSLDGDDQVQVVLILEAKRRTSSTYH